MRVPVPEHTFIHYIVYVHTYIYIHIHIFFKTNTCSAYTDAARYTDQSTDRDMDRSVAPRHWRSAGGRRMHSYHSKNCPQNSSRKMGRWRRGSSRPGSFMSYCIKTYNLEITVIHHYSYKLGNAIMSFSSKKHARKGVEDAMLLGDLPISDFVNTNHPIN